MPSSGGDPTTRARAAEWLKAFSLALRNVGLYSGGHPRARESCEKAYALLRSLLEGRRELRLSCSEGRLFLEDVSLDRDRELCRSVSRDMVSRGVETIDGGPDALSFAFVAIVGGHAEVWTMGMHVLGLRDVVMKRADVEAGGFDIIEVIRYLARGEKPIADGHVLADMDGPRYQAFIQDGSAELAGSPLHNPFGRLKLVNMRDIAESN
jgi:hypothetical protein